MSYRLLKIKPFFSERLWGSQELATKYNFKLPSKDKKYGEAWVISALENGPSYVKVDNKEIMLKDFFENNLDLFKNKNNYSTFPLLSKIITAKDYLSVQVHPDDNYALKNHNALGKPECWYVIDCKKDSSIIYGHNAKTYKELESYVLNGKWKELFKKEKINKGDFIYVPPGKVHALTPGVTVFELQRSSDLTYRFYDFDRKDSNGNLRPLHIKDCLNVTSVPDSNSLVIRNKKGLLIDNDYFSLYLLEQDFIKELKDINWAQITVLDGFAILDGNKLLKSESAIVFSSNNFWDIKIKGKLLFSYIK